VVDNILNEKYIKKQNFFNHTQIQKIRKGTNMYSARQIWCLLSFQIWYEQFFNDVSYKKIRAGL